MNGVVSMNSMISLNCPRAVAIACLSLISLSSQAADTSVTPRQQWYQDIGALYTKLAEATGQLQEDATALCSAPEANSEHQLRSDWLSAYRAWQAVRFVDFGPIEVNSRAWQLQFWPDKKNLVGSRVKTRLHQDTQISKADIDEAGVAEQGFPALEVLLYDDGMADLTLSAEQPCALLQAISTHLNETSMTLVTDWEAFGDYYQSTDSMTQATLHAAMQTLETIEDKRLGEPIGMMGSPANAYRAEAWRSDASISLIEASLQGLKEGFLPGLMVSLDNIDRSDLAQAFDSQLNKTIKQAQELDGGITSGLEHADAQAGLTTLYMKVAQLRQLLNEQIASALGVVRGFNSSDGD